jgi:hypothetical protein
MREAVDFDGVEVSVDFREAAKYFKAAADQGNSIDEFDYGLCLLEGNGTQQDIVAAYQYFDVQQPKVNVMVWWILVSVFTRASELIEMF